MFATCGAGLRVIGVNMPEKKLFKEDKLFDCRGQLAQWKTVHFIIFIFTLQSGDSHSILAPGFFQI